MSSRAPLAVCVEIALASGSDAGRRVFRLTRALELTRDDAAWLELGAALPIEGEGEGRVSFELPRGDLPALAGVPAPIEAQARLRFDPERPQDGARVQLLGLTRAQLTLIETYIEQRLLT